MKKLKPNETRVTMYWDYVSNRAVTISFFLNSDGVPQRVISLEENERSVEEENPNKVEM